MEQTPKREAPQRGAQDGRGRRYGLFGVSAYPTKKGMAERQRRSMVRWANGVIVLVFAAILVLVIIGSHSGGLTVTFDSQGGSAVASQAVTYGNRVEPPGEVLRPGYSLVGWSVISDGSQPWDFDSDVVHEGMTLYAIWTPDP